MAGCHVQTAPPFNIQHMPLFAQNWAEILFSDRVNAILIESKILTTPDECGINPVRLCVEMGGFWRFLASGVSYTQEEKKLTGYSLCVHMLAYW